MGLWSEPYDIGNNLNHLLSSLGLPVAGQLGLRKVRFFKYVGLGLAYK